MQQPIKRTIPTGTGPIRTKSPDGVGLTLAVNRSGCEDRTDIRAAGVLVGYIEADKLHGIGRDGYAVYLQDVQDGREAIGALRTWWNNVR